MNQERDVIHITPEHGRERQRRRLEIFLAVLLLFVVTASTWAQLSLYGVDSWLFIAILNINGVLMLAVLLLVVRNTVKLIMERRRKVFGARMRTRLVLMFVSLTLVPAVIMFLASNRIVARSVDYWFTNQTESSLQAALDVGRSFYTSAASRLRTNAESVERQLVIRGISPGSPEIGPFLAQERQDSGLSVLGIVSRRGETKTWEATDDFEREWNDVRRQINWEQIAENRFGSLLWTTQRADYVIGIHALEGHDDGFLVLSDRIGQGLMAKIEGIAKGFEDYAQLKQLKAPLKLSYLIILGILGLATIFGSIWMAFRLSKQISDPILALAEGTNRIARGDLDFRLEDTGRDEIGQLVQSFNSMARDLQQSREQLTRANELLGRQNAAVAERNVYIEAVLDSIATGVITLDAEGRVLTANKAACSIFHTSPHRIQGLDPLVVLPSAYADNFSGMLETLREKPDEHWIRQVDFGVGNRTWKLIIHAVALTGPEGIQAFLAVIEDITELEKMQRVAAWREVARRIAHEIKNPLTPIKLSAQRLERRFSKDIHDPVFGQGIELIVRQVERMQDMVEEFSSFAKLPEIRLVPGNPTALIEEAVTMFRTSHGQFGWELSLEADLPDIAMDIDALHRALFNIFSNAAEVLAEKTEKERAEGRDFKGKISVRAVRVNATGGLKIIIEDNGPGLSKEEQERAFEPYYSRKKGGTGLGLAIVHTVISEHRGEITATSLPQGGTMFTMIFPPYAASQPIDGEPD